MQNHRIDEHAVCATGIKPSMESEHKVEYRLGPANVNGNINHSSQTHKLSVQPNALGSIRIKNMSLSYDPVLAKD